MPKLSAILLILFLFGISSPAAPKAQAPQKTDPAQGSIQTQEWEALYKRFELHGFKLMSSMWGLTHGYRSKTELDKAMKLFQTMLEAMEKNNPSRLQSIGGVQGFMNSFLEIMRSRRDDVVAGFAAKVLAVFGSTRYASDIAEILKGRDKSWTDESTYPSPTVRGQAAIALSIIEATQYKEDIAALLRSMNIYDRSGAVYALAQLKATEYGGEIASLLARKEFTFRRDESPIHALIDMGLGRQYKKEIAQALGSESSSEVQETAAYALAHLQATEYSSEIAKMLTETYRRSNAAKALAIMGEKQYAEKIAKILDDDNPLHQSAALLALGVLGAKQYTPKVATFLKRKESRLSHFAAIALLLMEVPEYRKEAAEILGVNKTGVYLDSGDFSDLVSKEVGEINKRVVDALAEFRKNQ